MKYYSSQMGASKWVKVLVVCVPILWPAGTWKREKNDSTRDKIAQEEYEEEENEPHYGFLKKTSNKNVVRKIKVTKEKGVARKIGEETGVLSQKHQVK